MTDRHAFLLSPYRPPTSYAVTLNTAETASWLNAYAALWHPAVLGAIAGPPQPASVYDHDQPGEGFIFALPEGPTVYQADDWRQRVRDAKAVAFAATASREETYTSLREGCQESGLWREVDAELVRLFAGVGYGYLMVDTLFDAMSHDKLLDAAGFWADVRAAVEKVHDPREARSHLKDAAEKLKVAREGAYSGNVHLLEWVMSDPANLGEPWPAAVTGNSPVSVIASAELLERMANEHPERFAELKARTPTDLPAAVELCVGSYRERDDAILPVESQWWNLRTGREHTRAQFGQEPTVFARRSSAYSPQSPSWWQQFGYRHGIVVSFDGALIPSRYSAVVSWPGPDGKTVDVFTREPQPAHESQTFFNFAYLLHQAISHDSTPTLTLLHKKAAAVGYGDYLALGDLAPVFGEAMSMSRYFAETHAGDYTGAATGDEFFADYLDDRVTNRHRPDPVGGFARHLRLRRRIDSAFALAALHRSLTPETPEDNQRLQQLTDLEDAIETRGPDLGTADTPDELSQKLEPLEAAFAKQLADRVQVRAVENRPGFMLFNSCGFARRVIAEFPNQPGPIAVEGMVKASEFEGGVARVVVEIPGLGFAWVPKGSARNALPKPRIKTAETTVVRNEFFEAELDPDTGGLRAFRDSKTRINRLGQMLVFNPGSKMVATGVSVTHAGTAFGEVTSEGRIENEHGEPLAAFRQRVRAWMGRPVLEMCVEITPRHAPTGYPWHAYYGARFGYRDDRTATFRGVNGANSQSTHARPVSPDYLEFRLGSERTFVFTGGLPFVQRHGTRMMDVVLIPEGETATSFDLLIATDREYPMQTAAGWVVPTPVVETTKGPPHIGESGWLAAVDLPSLLLTSLRPAAAEEGKRAIAARFLETAGFAGSAELRFARDPTAAKLVDLMGVPLNDVTLIQGAIPLEFSAGEAVSVRAEFA
ncbi:hypothetical protein [Limnoglobus roseus]|uniref:Uncharacterized protein n=1 Tax=Limnoglobus roseus TaxID=2598579 RepID=A0A5C1AKE8_9BACT|nr:hypothetical protein [Limnoglobus roseus]QEL19701.1 hypothetical protein PX52LOC_06780 [Limnoglobus roseus]